MSIPLGNLIVINSNIVLIENRKKAFESKFKSVLLKQNDVVVDEDGLEIPNDEPTAQEPVFNRVEFTRKKMLEEHNRRFYMP